MPPVPTACLIAQPLTAGTAGPRSVIASHVHATTVPGLDTRRFTLPFRLVPLANAEPLHDILVEDVSSAPTTACPISSLPPKRRCSSTPPSNPRTVLL